MKDINEIDTTTTEGRLLLMAIGRLTTGPYSNRTPNSVLTELKDLAEDVYKNEPPAVVKK